MMFNDAYAVMDGEKVVGLSPVRQDNCLHFTELNDKQREMLTLIANA